MIELLLLVGAAAILLAVVDRTANRFVRPVLRPPDRTFDDFEPPLAHEDALVQADGHTLAAWILRPEGEPLPPVFVLAHGWGASFGTVLRLGAPLVRAGYEVILFDVRGHGRNEELPYVTVRHFRDDVAAVVEWVAARFPARPTILVGHSLGGAGALLAAADGAQVDALALIAAPSDVMRVTAEYLSDQGLPGDLIVRFYRPFFWRRIGSTFRRLTPWRRIAELDIPLLILQPEHDQRVARAHAERLSAAAGQPYVIIRDAEHTDVLEHPETVRRLEEFARSVRRPTV